MKTKYEKKLEKEFRLYGMAYKSIKPKDFSCKVSSIRVNRQESRIRALDKGILPDERLNTLNGGEGYTNLYSPTKKNGIHC